MAENRRSSARHPVSIPSNLTVDGRSIECTILNLSLGGASISSTTRFAMGQRAQITFPIPTSAEPINIGATVRWTDAEKIGIQFDGLRARDVWALNEYFKQLA